MRRYVFRSGDVYHHHGIAEKRTVVFGPNVARRDPEARPAPGDLRHRARLGHAAGQFALGLAGRAGKRKRNDQRHNPTVLGSNALRLTAMAICFPFPESIFCRRQVM